MSALKLYHLSTLHRIAQYFPAYHIFGTLLSALVVLHVFWAYYIFKTAYIAFYTPGAIKSDSRGAIQ